MALKDYTPTMAAEDMTTAQKVGEILEKHYPGWGWAVHADSRTGMVNVMSLKIQGELFGNKTYGFQMYMQDVTGDPSLKAAVRAGGEILERSNMARRRFNGILPTRVEGVAPQHQPRVIR